MGRFLANQASILAMMTRPYKPRDSARSALLSVMRPVFGACLPALWPLAQVLRLQQPNPALSSPLLMADLAFRPDFALVRFLCCGWLCSAITGARRAPAHRVHNRVDALRAAASDLRRGRGFGA